MADPEAAIATQLRNIEGKTGKTFAQLCKLIADSGLTKVGEQRAMLMEKLRLNIVAAIMKQIGKIVDGCKGVDVLSSKHSLSLCQALAKEVFSSRVVSLVLKRKRLFLHHLWAQRGGRRCGLLRLFA